MRSSAATAALLAAVLLFCPSLVSTEVAHDSLDMGRGLTKHQHTAVRTRKAHNQHVPVLLTKDTHRRRLLTNDEQEEEEDETTAADDSQDEAEFEVDEDGEDEDEDTAEVSGDEDGDQNDEDEEEEGEDEEREPADPSGSEGNADGNDGDGASANDESADADADDNGESDNRDSEGNNKQSADDESTDGEGKEDAKANESTDDGPDNDDGDVDAVDQSKVAESEEQVVEDGDGTAQSEDVESDENEEDQPQDEVEGSKSEVVESSHVSEDHTNEEEEETAAVHSPASNQYASQKTASAPGGNANARAPMIISSSSQQTQTSSSITAPTKSTTIRRGPLARIKGIFGISSSAKNTKNNTGGGRKWRRKKKKQTPEEMLYHDITLAFINGLKSGLYDDLEKPLSTERKQLLLDWCDLLSATLPPEFGLHRIINLLRSNWIHISSSRRNLMSILSVSLPAEKDYSDECTQPTKKRLFGAGPHTKSPSRGSTCAFWRLLHTLSVGLAERKGGTDASTDDEVLRDVDAALGVVGGKHRRNHRPFSPKEAAEIIRNVVDTFFTCEVCRKNFIEQYDSCQYGRCDKLKDTTEGLSEDDWREMSLWLWQYHNGVTSTVSKKAAESTDAKAVSSGLAWPSAKDCSSCKLSNGSWDHMHVYRYLREVYWGDEEVSTAPVDAAYRMGDLNGLDTKSMLILIGIVAVILASIRLWSRRYLLKHNIGYLPLSSHLNGKTSGKKE